MTACVGCSRSSGRNRNLVDYLPTQRQARPPRVRPHKPPALLAERISSTTAPHVTTPPLNGCVCKCSVVRWKCSGAPRPLRVVLRQVAILPAAASVLSVRNGMPQFDIEAKSHVHFLQNSFACITSQFKDDHFITPDEKTEKKKIMSEKTFLTG